MAFDRDPQRFVAQYAASEAATSRRLADARVRVREIAVSDHVVERAASLCAALGTDGLRGELTLIRAARAAASLEGATETGEQHLKLVAALALRHRLRRDPLDEVGSTVRVDRALEEVFAA
jgi:magnesium chelatase subunit I